MFPTQRRKDTTVTSAVESAFDILADAAQVRYPDPNRNNRGLCPAHDDHNNPGLVFKISETGNLVVHCFAQQCTVTDIAASIGLSVSDFFPGQRRPGQVYVPIEWSYPSALELLKALNLGYSWDEQVEAVFRTLEADEDIGYLFDNAPFHVVPFTIMRDVYLYNYVEPHWRATNTPWYTKEHDGYSDQAMRRLGKMSQQLKTNNLTRKAGSDG